MITSDWLFNSVHLKTTQKKEYIISILRFTFIKAEVNYTCALLFVSVLGANNTPSLSQTCRSAYNNQRLCLHARVIRNNDTILSQKHTKKEKVVFCYVNKDFIFINLKKKIFGSQVIQLEVKVCLFVSVNDPVFDLPIERKSVHIN